MKSCNICSIIKPYCEFTKREANKDGYKNQCKTCISQYNKTYGEINKVILREKKKQYEEKNKNIIRKKKKIYSEKNKDKKRLYDLIYTVKNKPKRNKREKHKRENDNLYRLKGNVRTLIGGYIRKRGFSKKSKTSEILGCSFEEFKIHIESQFEDWMTWDNYGKYNGSENYGWDIDHIIPLVFAITENDVIKLNHFTNLQPLCSKINRDIKRDLV